jgi:hypothetical protein
MQQVGVGFAMIGALVAVYDFAEIFPKPVFGILADRKGDQVGIITCGILGLCTIALLRTARQRADIFFQQ